MEIDYMAPIAMIDNVLWLVSEGGIARLYPDGHWEISSTAEQGLPDEGIEKIVSREDGIYLVVANGIQRMDERFIMHLERDIWRFVKDPNIRYFESPDGVLWRGEKDRLSKSLDHGSSWKYFFDAQGWLNPCAIDAAGLLYISTEDAILVVNGDKVVEEYRFTDIGPELNSVDIIDWDNRGHMWLATNGHGMTMFDGAQWYNWQEGISGMGGDCVLGLAIGDKLYVGTCTSGEYSGVNIFDFKTERWTNIWTGESELRGGEVYGLANDSQGRAYFPTEAGILNIYDGRTWKHIPMSLQEEYTTLGISEGLFDKDGNYWVATKGLQLGLWKYNGQAWTIYDIHSDINALALDGEGRIWLGTNEGLAVRDLNGNWLFYTAKQLPLGDKWIQDIAIDQAGRVWVISFDSLIVFNGEEYQAFDPSLAGATHWGDAVTIDPQGNVWVEAGGGIAKFSGKPKIDGFTSLTLQPERTIYEKDIRREIVVHESILTRLWAQIGLFSTADIFRAIVIGLGVLLFFMSRRKKDSLPPAQETDPKHEK